MRFERSWYELVMSCLRELSDLEFQERVWLRGEGPEVSSFAELVCQLFDDTGLADFLEEAQSESIVSPQADSILLELALQLDRIDSQLGAREILSYSAWPKIRRLASEAVNLVIQQMDKSNEADAAP